ncbi:MAG: hypothetical protein NT120_04595 [Candidatus Aenigmarchaeota archaeon]|nr:hypothetical protein [Candidatus Aenigmarchaeota archaeon]
MFFKKKDAPILQEIKNAMNEQEEFPTIKQIGNLPPKPQIPTMPNLPVMDKPVERDASAPLFVKVDKYREILKGLQEMKLFVSGVKQTFTVLQEIESIRADTINIMRATVQRLEKSLTEIDANLLRPKGVSLHEMGVAGVEVRHLENTLTDLQKQMSVLRSEMEGLR